MKKENKINKEKIFEIYGDYLLNHGERPRNVFQFSQANNFEESKFYEYFSSFEEIEKQILAQLFSKSLELASGMEEFETLTAKEKLLNVYYIFFENLTLNRSLVMMFLGQGKIDHFKTFQSLKQIHREFTKTLYFEENKLLEKAPQNVKNLNEKSKEEMLWLHLVSCIEFWKKDTSPSFEKTDLFIEKTIDTGFELIDNEPLKKVMDLGKFLWKEKFGIS